MGGSDINKLPQQILGKSGWPWTVEPSQLLHHKQVDPNWPKISIVTPSYNQGKFIEETIRSVLLQGYPDIEYIIIDGGSNDETTDILKKYEPWLSYWVSEPDRGQSHALNKGFARATGEIFAYINSDDLYERGALEVAGRTFVNQKQSDLLAGECTIFDDQKEIRIFKPWWPSNPDHMLLPFGSTFAQPASFWTKTAYESVGGFDESLHFVLDREFFLKLSLQGVIPILLPQVLARYREHAYTKTRQTIKIYEESMPLIKKYADNCGLTQRNKKQLLWKTNNEIGYLSTFICWKRRGRFAAIRWFFVLLMKSPTLIFQRKIMGLARRLAWFKSEDVLELNNV